jgi:hypothetical protein
MEQKDGSISGAVKVGKLRNGYLVIKSEDHGDSKLLGGDHLLTVETKRPAEPGEKEYDPKLAEGETQPEVTRTWSFILDQDAAKTLGVFLEETVEEENVRLAKEAEENPPPPPDAPANQPAQPVGASSTPAGWS